MRPSLRPARAALFRKCRAYGPGEIVVARTGGREVVKRLLAVGRHKVYLQGDHPDSADCAVNPEDLRGRLVLSFGRVSRPRLPAPPRPARFSR